MTLVAAAALSFADPAGDAHGDGGYVLPLRPAVSPEALDLRSFEVEVEGHTTRMTVDFGAHQNPWKLPSGFSAGVTDIFIKTDAGGERDLKGLGLRPAGNDGWQYHLQIDGARQVLEQVQGGQRRVLTPPRVSMNGTRLVIETDRLPTGRHAYWVTSSVYTPLSPDGRMRPDPAPNASGLQAAGEERPVPVDVLAAPGDRRAYETGTLAAVGQTRDWRLATLAALGVFGLGLTGLSVWRSWRLQDEE